MLSNYFLPTISAQSINFLGITAKDKVQNKNVQAQAEYDTILCI